MTMFMMMIDIASVEIVEKVQVTRRHSTICTMFTKVKTHQNSALIGNILYSFSFYLVIVLSCFHNLHIVKIENQLCLSSDVTVIDWVADVHNGLVLRHPSWKKEITRYLSSCFPPKRLLSRYLSLWFPDSGKPMKQVEDERFLSSAAAKHSINSISPFLPTLSYLICSFTIPVPFHQYTFSLPLSWFKTLLTNIFWCLTFCILNLTVWELIRTWYPAAPRSPF